jgi:hypothetical protein
MGANDKRISQLTQWTGSLDGNMQIPIVFNGENYSIKVSSLTAQTDIVSTKYLNQSADFTIDLPSNIRLESIDILKVSGTPVITIGSTLAGVEYLDSTTVADTFGCNLFTPINGTSTIYIAISGGNANFNVTYKTNNL